MPESRRHTLPRSARLLSGPDFDRIFAGGVRAADRFITLFAATNGGRTARLGISAPRHLGNAVRRNRFKRLIREAFRTVRHDLPAGIDWVVVPRRGGEPEIGQLRDSLVQLAAQLHRRLARAASPGAGGDAPGPNPSA